jgi:hypothetical protein
MCTADRPDEVVERVLLTKRRQSFVLKQASGAAWLKV